MTSFTCRRCCSYCSHAVEEGHGQAWPTNQKNVTTLLSGSCWKWNGCGRHFPSVGGMVFMLMRIQGCNNLCFFCFCSGWWDNYIQFPCAIYWRFRVFLAFFYSCLFGYSSLVSRWYGWFWSAGCLFSSRLSGPFIQSGRVLRIIASKAKLCQLTTFCDAQ